MLITIDIAKIVRYALLIRQGLTGQKHARNCLLAGGMKVNVKELNGMILKTGLSILEVLLHRNRKSAEQHGKKIGIQNRTRIKLPPIRPIKTNGSLNQTEKKDWLGFGIG